MIDGHRSAASHVLSDEYLFIFVFETTITNDRTSSTYTGRRLIIVDFHRLDRRVSVDVFNYAHTNGDDTLRERILCVYAVNGISIFVPYNYTGLCNKK